MHCSEYPKDKIIYFSFFLPRVSVSPRTSVSVFAMDRRIKKIEKICHCKIKIDTINPKICKTLLNGYHLFEIYYHESKGNHTGCMYMLKELLTECGNIQAVITITKSKEGRVIRKNSLTDNVSYQLYHSSSYHETSLNLNSEKNIQVLERQLTSLEVIEEEFLSLENAPSFISRPSDPNEDDLLKLYTIVKPIYDSQKHSLIIKSKHLESMSSRNSENSSLNSFLNECLPKEREIGNTDNIEDLSFDDDYISVLSSCSTNLSSSASSFEDAISQSVVSMDKGSFGKFIDCHEILDQLDYETLKNTNVINQAIDEIGVECFDRHCRILRVRILNYINMIKFASSQLIIMLFDLIISEQVRDTSFISIEIEKELRNGLLKEFVEIFDSHICCITKVLCKDDIGIISENVVQDRTLTDELNLTLTNNYTVFNSENLRIKDDTREEKKYDSVPENYNLPSYLF